MKILIIEDELAIASLLKRGLEMENFEIDLAHDGQKGFDMGKSGNYDLIILDLMLPQMDGIELCKRLRSLKIKTPIIMLTARDTARDRMIGMKAGASDYVLKPFSLEELSKRISILLNREKKLADKIFENEISDENKRMSQLHHKILDNAPISMITIDKDGFMTSANKYFHNLSSTKDFRKKNIFSSEFFIRENLVEDYRKLLTDGKEIVKDKCFEKNALGEKYLKIIAVPLRDENGEIEGALSMAVDNTESVVAKKKLQLLNKELEDKVAKRTAELEIANKNLAKVLELKAMFVADVSHEMRTALAIIQGNLELISRGLIEKADQKKTYSQVYEEISRMSIMLTDMTLLSESETSKQRLDIVKVDINKLISSLCRSLKVVADKRQIKINHQNSKSKIEMLVDVVQIQKLLINLLNNAIRYNKENGTVDIAVKVDGERVAISVRDSGIGISRKYIDNIFECFYRVDKARSRNNGGSGLGLTICKWVAEMHKGSIEVESTLGKGSTFTVYLPKNVQRGLDNSN